MNKKTVTIVGSSSVATLVLLLLTMSQGSPSGNAAPDGCLPTSISQAEQSFPIREPNLLLISDNAALQGVDEGNDLVTMYYASFSLCPFLDSRESFFQRGGLTLTVFKAEPTYRDSVEFQEGELAYFTSNPRVVADVKPIEVNGFKGVGWDPYQSASVTRLNGKIIESTPMLGPGAVRFYNEMDGTIYFINADRSLDEMLKIASSIQ